MKHGWDESSPNRCHGELSCLLPGFIRVPSVAQFGIFYHSQSLNRQRPERGAARERSSTMEQPDNPLVPRRLGSIDAYRGLVMFLMMAEVLHLCAVARARPESRFWAFLCHHQEHVEWVGCSLHDL